MKFLHYAKNLGFEERPDYDKIRLILRGLLSKGGQAQNPYDWSMQKPSVPQNTSNLKVSQKRKVLCGLLKFESKINSSICFFF